MFRLIFLLGILFSIKLFAADTTATSADTTSKETEAKTDKNKTITPIYETYYDSEGKKQVRAYQYGFKLKEQLGSKEKNEVVHYEKNADGELNAYKWGYQLKDQIPKQSGSAPKSGILTHKKAAPASTNSGAAEPEDMDEEAPSAASATGNNPELKNKILEMIRAQRASSAE